MPSVVAITLIIAIFSVPLAFILGPAIGSLAPLLYIAAGVYGIKYLMDHRHSQRLIELEKRKEVEELAYRHLQEADQLLGKDSKF